MPLCNFVKTLCVLRGKKTNHKAHKEKTELKSITNYEMTGLKNYERL